MSNFLKSNKEWYIRYPQGEFKEAEDSDEELIAKLFKAEQKLYKIRKIINKFEITPETWKMHKNIVQIKAILEEK